MHPALKCRSKVVPVDASRRPEVHTPLTRNFSKSGSVRTRAQQLPNHGHHTLPGTKTEQNSQTQVLTAASRLYCSSSARLLPGFPLRTEPGRGLVSTEQTRERCRPLSCKAAERTFKMLLSQIYSNFFLKYEFGGKKNQEKKVSCRGEST